MGVCRAWVQIVGADGVTRGRVRAPELQGRSWLNTGGVSVSLAEQRGRFVLLDFWTFCCINCLHVLDEMRPIEARYADVLTVIGVHSPKFAHESDPAALAAAVERYEVDHPVLDDPDLISWQNYTVRAWPTLVLIDPQGYIVAQFSGEGHGHAIDALLAELVPDFAARGLLRFGDSPFVAPPPATTVLRYPGAAVALPDGRMLVSDTQHHRLVIAANTETALDGQVIQVIGDGQRGLLDGDASIAQFSEPQGLCLLPAYLAEAVGYDVVVADTVNHVLRGFNSSTGKVTTVAGTGLAWMQGDSLPTIGHELGFELGDDAGEGSTDTSTPLSSPWDVVWWPAIDQVVVAMAGIHQIWLFDPRTNRVAAWAGTTNEGLRDGQVGQAWFAQPSGLAVDGSRLWVADSETSALRRIDLVDSVSADQVPADQVPADQGPAERDTFGNSPAGADRVALVALNRALSDLHERELRLTEATVTTVIGTGLFDFGLRDGTADQALLQHPLGVTVLPDGSVAICDTYNGAIRRYEPQSRAAEAVVTTMVAGLSEPSAAFVDGETLVVVESGAHQLVRVPLGAAAVPVEQFQSRTHRPVTTVAPGRVRLEVVFTAPPGQKLDERFGPATRLVISSTPPALLRSGEGRDTGLARTLNFDATVGEGVLHVAAMAASCDSAADGSFAEGAACHVHQQDWGIPIRLDVGGPDALSLMLGG